MRNADPASSESIYYSYKNDSESDGSWYLTVGMSIISVHQKR